jgi:hypothetical protein
MASGVQIATPRRTGSEGKWLTATMMLPSATSVPPAVAPA